MTIAASVKDFLSFLRKEYLSSKIEGPLRIVCGNEAADLDSIVSAITYAYFSFLHKDAVPLVPIISIPRAELRLRRDAEYLMLEHSIPLELLFFVEDLEKLKAEKQCRVSGVLVDHNEVEEGLAKLIDEVVGIIDHHVDLNLYRDSIAAAKGPRIIEPAGSCTSLVYNYWYEKLGMDAAGRMSEAAPLCLGPILLDTSNLEEKVTSHDTNAFERCKKDVGQMDTEAYYKALKAARQDVDGFSLRDLLRKDYKEFRFPTTTGEVSVGMSSTIKPFLWACNTFGARTVASGWRDYLTERRLDYLMVLARVHGDVCVKRELSIVAVDAIPKNRMSSLAYNISQPLQLEEVVLFPFPTDGIRTFIQHNVSASRKQIAPVVKNACARL